MINRVFSPRCIGICYSSVTGGAVGLKYYKLQIGAPPCCWIRRRGHTGLHPSRYHYALPTLDVATGQALIPGKERSPHPEFLSFLRPIDANDPRIWMST